jgi:hypothetical protein
MKYEVTISGVDRETADKLYRMALQMGADVEVEESDEDEKPSKGILSRVAGEDE